jgi:Cu/Zn superoxide dismutase
VKRLTKAVLGGVAGCALALGGTQFASGALEAKYSFRDALTDFLTTDGPFDSATAKITIADKTRDKTTFRIRITGIDPSIAGTTLGSHLHTGKCVDGDFGTSTPPVIPGFQAGPHYNHNAVMGLPAEVSPKTEVWFDLVPDEDGVAQDQTTVHFVPVDPDGYMSVVVHVLPTNTTTGAAGTRQACFPLSVAGIFPTTPPSPTE